MTDLPCLRFLNNHGRAILGTVQRLPLLFWLDTRLRIYAAKEMATIKFYVEFVLLTILLTLDNRSLGKIYKFFMCFVFMIMTWPFSKYNIWNFLIRTETGYRTSFTMQKRTFHIHLYYHLAVSFLVIATFLKVVSFVVKLYRYFPSRLVVMGTSLTTVHVLARALTGVCSSVFQNNVLIILYHLALVYLTNDLFRIKFVVYLSLVQFYYTLYWHSITFYLFFIIIAVSYYFEEGDELYSVKNALSGIKQVKMIGIDCNTLLLYSILLCIFISLDLHNASVFLAGTIFLTTINIICATLLGTIAYVSGISYITLLLPTATMWFLRGKNHARNTSDHYTCKYTFAFFILEAQSYNSAGTYILIYCSQNSGIKLHGIIMCFGIFILAGSVLEDLHKIVDSFLLEVGASGAGFFKTCKAVSAIIILIIFPIFIVVKLYQIRLIDIGIVWFIVVTSTWLSVTVEAIGSLSVYLLLVFDSLEPDAWINLDKSMYCVRVLIGIIHIFFGTLHICYLIWNITTIQWSWLGCIILVGCIYNIFERITNGWKEVHRLSFLPNATQEQLHALNDVCAVCLRNMKSAKVTPCNHYFHESCLTKWSYISKNFPLCSTMITTDWADEVDEFEDE
ncbi:RING finger protein 145-like [Mytilus californianus]|uniref:RING finger protein 145-like n=1 Tax=Mytilus californianus TaxID=6549 RepID=UPI0022478D22|nr:RING finger protein 145-like [Mytilus californianus]